MLITELGAATSILIGIALGVFNFVIIDFWIQLFSKYFDFSKSNLYLPVFFISVLVWTVGICVAPADLLNDSFDTWVVPFSIYFGGSLIVMFVVKLFGMK